MEGSFGNPKSSCLLCSFFPPTDDAQAPIAYVKYLKPTITLYFREVSEDHKRYLSEKVYGE